MARALITLTTVGVAHHYRAGGGGSVERENRKRE